MPTSFADDAIVFERRVRKARGVVAAVGVLLGTLALLWALYLDAHVALACLVGVEGFVGGALLGVLADAAGTFGTNLRVRLDVEGWEWQREGDRVWTRGYGPLVLEGERLKEGDRFLGWVGHRGQIEDVLRAVRASASGFEKLAAERHDRGFDRVVEDRATVDRLVLSVPVQDTPGVGRLRRIVPGLLLSVLLTVVFVWFMSQPDAVSGPQDLPYYLALLVAMGAGAILVFGIVEVMVAARQSTGHLEEVVLTATHLESRRGRWLLDRLQVGTEHHDAYSVLRVRPRVGLAWEPVVVAPPGAIRVVRERVQEAVDAARGSRLPMDSVGLGALQGVTARGTRGGERDGSG